LSGISPRLIAMDTPITIPPLPGGIGQPTWDVARLFPNQGYWTEHEYLALDGNYFVEFSDGCLEVLPMPTMTHQMIVAWLYGRLLEFITPQRMGRALFAPFRIRLRDGKYREPDVCFMLAEHAARMHDLFWEGADLVMEVVSNDDRRRDLIDKRIDYAQAGIPEYWIVDPQQSSITVLRLEGDEYAVHGQFGAGTMANSVLLAGFAVDVAALFASVAQSR
jgi:Uma2 family endonuclease